MSAVHSHEHHGSPATGLRRLVLALILTLGYAVIETMGGLWSGSLALLGDAGHMFSDGAALAVAVFAAWLARRPPSRWHTYGLVRAEVIAALFNSLLMLAVVTGIVIEAIDRLQQPRPVPGMAVMVVAAIGLGVNMLVLTALSHGEQDLNTRGAVLHVLGDLLGSVAALMAGAVIYFTGWMPIDPLLSLVICALILFSTLRLLRESLHVLMEGVPRHLDVTSVGRQLAAIPGVRSVHDLHIWTPAAGRAALSAHVVVDDLTEWMTILDAIRSMLLARFGIDHVTLQPETSAGWMRPEPLVHRPRPAPPRAQ